MSPRSLHAFFLSLIAYTAMLQFDLLIDVKTKTGEMERGGFFCPLLGNNFSYTIDTIQGKLGIHLKVGIGPVELRIPST